MRDKVFKNKKKLKGKGSSTTESLAALKMKKCTGHVIVLVSPKLFEKIFENVSYFVTSF